jgi:hypothetical protein
MAFIGAFFLSMFIGVAVLVGAGHFSPRDAAVMMPFPAAIIAAACAVFTPTRDMFSWWSVSS